MSLRLLRHIHTCFVSFATHQNVERAHVPMGEGWRGSAFVLPLREAGHVGSVITMGLGRFAVQSRMQRLVERADRVKDTISRSVFKSGIIEWNAIHIADPTAPQVAQPCTVRGANFRERLGTSSSLLLPSLQETASCTVSLTSRTGYVDSIPSTISRLFDPVRRHSWRRQSRGFEIT
jgi:hypothetical protein